MKYGNGVITIFTLGISWSFFGHMVVLPFASIIGEPLGQLPQILEVDEG